MYHSILKELNARYCVPKKWRVQNKFLCEKKCCVQKIVGPRKKTGKRKFKIWVKNVDPKKCGLIKSQHRIRIIDVAKCDNVIIIIIWTWLCPQLFSYLWFLSNVNPGRVWGLIISRMLGAGPEQGEKVICFNVCLTYSYHWGCHLLHCPQPIFQPP